jgi:hypothetical protein
MSTARLLLVIVGLAAVAACAGTAASPTSHGPTPTPAPTPDPTRTLAELKFVLIDELGPLWYCDPDFYPIQRQDELASALERWPEVVADSKAFGVIATRLNLDPAGLVADGQKLDVYRAWKVLNAIALDPIGNDAYRFDYLAQPATDDPHGMHTAGTISAGGEVTVEQQAPAGEQICPICLARWALVDAPGGPRPVEGLRIGDPVWTLDANGARVRGVVIAVGSTPAPAGHRVVRLVLADGRTVTASPGHPLADGRPLGEPRAGDAVDGSIVVATELVAYLGGQTYDLAVSGPSGIYFVDGIPLGSTLRP